MIQTLTAGDDSPHSQPGPLTPPGPEEPAPEEPAPVRVRPGSPGELLAIVPHLLGFVPQASLVVIGTEPPRDRVKVTLRYDLPDPPGIGVSADLAAHAAGVIGSQRLTAMMAVGYGPETLVDPVVEALRCAAQQTGIDLRDFLRVEDGRYWSYKCGDEACCPAAGTPFDPAASPAAAAMAAAGKQVLADRSAVADRVAPLGGSTAEAMRRATRRAERHVSQLLAKVRKSSRLGAARRLIAAEGLTAVGSMIATYRGGGTYATEYQIAWITVALRDLRVRDDAWARMDSRHLEAHRRLWIDVALANVALDRALADDPGYSMAQLLREVISAGAPPSLARLPMTPEEVAASYDDAEDEPSDLADSYGHEPDADVHDPDPMAEY